VGQDASANTAALVREIASRQITTIRVWSFGLDTATFGLLTPEDVKKHPDCEYDTTISSHDRDFFVQKLAAARDNDRPVNVRRVLDFRDANGATLHELSLSNAWINDDTVDATLDGSKLKFGVGILTFIDIRGKTYGCAP